jgi:hypothetical protein
MSALEFLLAHENIPFVASLVVMLSLMVFEIVGMLIGLGFSEALDSLLPEQVELEGPEIGAEVGAASALLSWLYVGRVPLLMLLILLLSSFGALGLLTQGIMRALFGHSAPMLAVSCVSLLLSLPLVRGSASCLGRIMPQDESSAVSTQSFVGRTATILRGRAQVSSPAEAKFNDQFGQCHYVLVEPDTAGETFESGCQVILVKTEGAVHKAIRA